MLYDDWKAESPACDSEPEEACEICGKVTRDLRAVGHLLACSWNCEGVIRRANKSDMMQLDFEDLLLAAERDIPIEHAASIRILRSA